MIADRLETLRRDGRLTEDQARTLTRLEQGEPFSIHGEIRAFFYVGVLLIAAGIGATVKTYFSSLGPASIVGGLSLGVLGCLAYVLRRGEPWSREYVPAPTVAFDYALFLACLLFSLDLGYVENRWHLLGGDWQRHLLVSAGVFLGLAYRHDNRLVLSLGLSSLAAWVGLEFKGMGSFLWKFPWESAIAFGVFCLGLGVFLARGRIKAHFLDVYLNFAALSLGFGLLSQTVRHGLGSFHAYALAGLCVWGTVHSFRVRKFVFLLYAAFFGYVGLTSVIFKTIGFHSVLFGFLYFIFSSLAFVGFLFWASRLMKEVV